MKFWYRDNWTGDIHEFASLRAAKSAAKNECGMTIRIHNAVGDIVCVADATGYTYP